MCGSEVTPKPQGLSAADRRLLAMSERVVASADAPPSPCISICRMSDDTAYCAGCWRSLDEIAGWASRSADDKRAVWQRIAQRLAAHAKTH